MFKKLKKQIIIFLVICISFCSFSCNKNNNTNAPNAPNLPNYGNKSDVVLWGAPATEKVLQEAENATQNQYSAFSSLAEIKLTVARGEYEASQIIITTKDKPIKYELEISELSSANGKKYSANNIEVFHEKYIEIKVNYEGTSAPTGNYPDALVPIENIKNAGENVVEPKSNQGLYFRFNTPIAQEAGEYAGSAKLIIGVDSVNIPILLKVDEAVVSAKPHTKSIFMNNWFFEKGELDTSFEMLDKYNRALFEYRLCPDKIMDQPTRSDMRIKMYVDKAYEYMQDERCTNLSVPYAEKANSEVGASLDTAVFEKYLIAFANKSFETGYNMYDKLVCYFGSLIDEPELQGFEKRTQVVVQEYNATLKKTSDSLEGDATIVSPIKSEVIASIKSLKNVITQEYTKAYADIGVETWCPKFYGYDTEQSRANYASQSEKWWYGCVDPKAPYPTYHMEDTLLSARSVGWMQAEYDITGNLYWGTDVYAKYIDNKYQDLDDCYENPSRFPNINGDGYLFYPGKPYGVDGPVASLRLEAIRDGLEEFELIYALKQKYKEISDDISAESMIRSLASTIYTGSVVNTTSKNFASARESLFEMSHLINNFDVYITDFRDDGYVKKIYEIIAPSNVSLKNNNVALAQIGAITAKNGKTFNRYQVEIQLTADKNELNLTVESNGEKYSFIQYIGGNAEIRKADITKREDFSKESITPVYELVNEDVVGGNESVKLAKITLPKAGQGKKQSFRMQGALINGINNHLDKVRLHVYYSGKEETELEIDAKYSKQTLYYVLAKSKLKAGWNTVDIIIKDVNWNKLGNIDYFVMYFGGKNNESDNIIQTIYIKDAIFYNK